MRVYIKEFMPKMISKYLNLELQIRKLAVDQKVSVEYD